MDLSIIIINWNSVDFLGKCLASLYSNTRGISFEVLVVDNGSYDGCAELIQREFPAVRFIQSQENLGFARGNNLASKYSIGRILLFLNPDTEPVGPALQRMVACMQSQSDAGAVGPKLLNTDLSIQTSCLQSFPSLLNQVLDTEYLRALFPKWSLWGNRALFEESREPVSVDGISGASLMVRRAVFEEVGRFSGDYFMYGEDMDLCYRIQKAGWKNYYVGDAAVIHHGRQSSKLQSNNHFSSIMIRNSLLTYFRVHRGNMYARVFQSATAIAALCRIVLLGLAMALAVRRLRKQLLLPSIAKWARVFRWGIGLEV